MDSIKLAKDFAAFVREVVTPAQLAIINSRNTMREVGVCHSHDFCDANQCMIDALEEQNESLDIDNTAQALLIAEAWDIARDCEFSVTRLTALWQQEEAVAKFQDTGEAEYADTAARLALVSGFEFGPQQELIPTTTKGN